MKLQKYTPYFFSMLLLTVGTVGVVTAYSALPAFRSQLEEAGIQEVPQPLTDSSAEILPKVEIPVADTTIRPGINSRVSVLNDWLQAGARNNKAASISRTHVFFVDGSDTLQGRLSVSGGVLDLSGATSLREFLTPRTTSTTSVVTSDTTDHVNQVVIDPLTGRSTLNAYNSSGVFDPVSGRRIQQHTTVVKSTVEPARIYFTRYGRVTHSVPISSDGSFTVTGLRQGSYGVGAILGSSVLAFSMYVGTTEDLNDAGFSQEQITSLLKQQAAEPLNVDAVLTNPADYQAVMGYLYQSLSTSTSRTLATSTRLTIPGNVDFNSARAGTSMRTHPLRLTPAGSLLGRVRKPVDTSDGTAIIQSVAGAEVTFFQNNAAVATVTTDINGEFEVYGIQQGNYSLVARSAEGVSVLGVTVHGNDGRVLSELRDAPAKNRERETQNVNQLGDDAGVASSRSNTSQIDQPVTVTESIDLCCDITLMEDFGLLLAEEQLLEEFLDEELLGECCGAAAGCCGGFGGVGGAAGGSLWPLLGLAGLAGLLGDDDDPPGDDPVSP